MKKHELDLDAEIQGIYLSTEMIDLMSIIQSKSMRELQDFVQESNIKYNINLKPVFSYTEVLIEPIKK